MKKLFALATALFLCGCAEDSAKSAVEANGFTHVTLGGVPWFGCGNDDNPFYNKKFTAIGLNGKPVQGIACGGMLKGWTVRID